MKKIISTIAVICYLLAFQYLNAQITVHDTDVMKFQSIYKTNYDYMPSGIDTGAAGANRSWDLSGLNPVFTDTVRVIPMGSSPIGPALPGNRILMKTSNDGNFEFYSRSEDMLTTSGYVALMSMKVQNKPAEVRLKFPAVYGQTHQGESFNNYTYYVGEDLSTGYIVDSLRHRTGITYAYEIDGWGKVTTPAGTFDVLRQRVSVRKVDSIDVLRQDLNLWVTDFSIDEEVETRYVFWSNSEYLPVAILNDHGNTGAINEASWIEVERTSAIKPVNLNTTVTLFPNPAEQQISLLVNDPQLTLASITDASGRVIAVKPLDSGKGNFDISGLSAGIYFIALPEAPSVKPLLFVKK